MIGSSLAWWLYAQTTLNTPLCVAAAAGSAAAGSSVAPAAWASVGRPSPPIGPMAIPAWSVGATTRSPPGVSEGADAAATPAPAVTAVAAASRTPNRPHVGSRRPGGGDGGEAATHRSGADGR